jgi:hypothetical protein
LRKQISNVKPSVGPDSEIRFPISDQMHLRLFNFLFYFPSKTAMNHFSLIQSSFVQVTSVFNLFNWNNTFWTSQDEKNKDFSFMFCQVFLFR